MHTLLPLADLKIGDRIRLVRGLMKGQTGRISRVYEDGTYGLIGDWTQQTGFVHVSYGPVERHCLEKLQSAGLLTDDSRKGLPNGTAQRFRAKSA